MASTFGYNSQTISAINAWTQESLGVRRIQESSKSKQEMGEGTTLYYNIINQTGACGVGNAYGFSTLNCTQYGKNTAEQYKKYSTKEWVKNYNTGGCGFLSAAFIDTTECKKMFQFLRDNFPILYQSPIRFNVNSGNNFFFCIFDTGEKEIPAEYIDPDHDDYDENHEPGFSNGLTW